MGIAPTFDSRRRSARASSSTPTAASAGCGRTVRPSISSRRGVGAGTLDQSPEVPGPRGGRQDPLRRGAGHPIRGRQFALPARSVATPSTSATSSRRTWPTASSPFSPSGSRPRATPTCWCAAAGAPSRPVMFEDYGNAREYRERTRRVLRETRRPAECGPSGRSAGRATSARRPSHGAAPCCTRARPPGSRTPSGASACVTRSSPGTWPRARSSTRRPATTSVAPGAVRRVPAHVGRQSLHLRAHGRLRLCVDPAADRAGLGRPGLAAPVLRSEPLEESLLSGRAFRRGGRAPPRGSRGARRSRRGLMSVASGPASPGSGPRKHGRRRLLAPRLRPWAGRRLPQELKSHRVGRIAAALPGGRARPRIRRTAHAHRRGAVLGSATRRRVLRWPGGLRRDALRRRVRARGDPPRVVHLQGRPDRPTLPGRADRGGPPRRLGARARRRHRVVRNETGLLDGDGRGRRERATVSPDRFSSAPPPVPARPPQDPGRRPERRIHGGDEHRRRVRLLAASAGEPLARHALSRRGCRRGRAGRRLSGSVGRGGRRRR